MKVIVGTFVGVFLLGIIFLLYPSLFLHISNTENVSVQGAERQVDDIILSLSRIVEALEDGGWAATETLNNDYFLKKTILIGIFIFIMILFSGVIFYIFRLRKEVLNIKINDDTLLNNINKNVLQLLPDDIDSLLKLAEQGLAQAQHSVGVCFYNGKGVPKDEQKAVLWFKKAAEQGLSKAQYNLGVCYYNGEGVSKNQNEAVKWYKRAADQGDTVALRAMLISNTWGIGTPQNTLLGYTYLLTYKAAGGDDKDLLSQEVHLEKALSPPERANAQQQARLMWEKIQTR